MHLRVDAEDLRRARPYGRELNSPVSPIGFHKMATSPIATWAGAAAIFMSISRIHQYLTPLGRISAPAIASILSLVLILRTARKWRPRDLRRHWIPKYLGIITFIAVVGVPFALYPGRAFSFLHAYFLRTLLLALIAWAISRTPEGAKFMARTLAVSGLSAVVLALVEGRTDSSGRLSGVATYDPNDLALIAVVTLPLTVYWITDRGSRLGKLLILAIPMILWVILESESRGGFLGLAAVTVGFLYLGFSRAPRRIRKMSQILLAGVILALPFTPSSYVERISSITDQSDYNWNSPRGRVQVWKRGMGYALSNPILGVGLNNFNTAEGRMSEEGQRRAEQNLGWKWSTAHNSFVQLTAELGLIAGVLFIFLFLRSTILLLGTAFRPSTQTSPIEMLAPFLGLSLIGYSVAGFFLSFAYYDIVYVLLALASAVLLSLSNEKKAVLHARNRDISRSPTIGS